MTMPVFNGRQVPSDVIAAIRNGQLIEAVKCWRSFTGESLLDSKNFIEAIRPQVLGMAREAARSSQATGSDLPKHELLLKLLKMTTSSNDAEALVAMRKANQLRKS
jgi:hypothetical protein